MIEGKSERRQWLWELKNAPVRIANYELLSRDREFFDPPGGAKVVYDLVVLDESQRIKNKSNVTSEAARAIPRRRNWRSRARLLKTLLKTSSASLNS